MPSRGLSQMFLEKLKSGDFSALLKRVREDATLCLEIRSNYINIYYRGGNILKLAENRPAHFRAWMDPFYFEPGNRDLLGRLPKRILDAEVMSQWIEALPALKNVMDCFFGRHPAEEREYKQLVVRDNNWSHGATSTDYFIVDMEYSTDGAQFDFVAAHWPSTAAARKNPRCPRLTFIEMKVGDSAIGSVDGSGKQAKPGLAKHLADIETFCQPESDGSPSLRLACLKDEMIEIYKQKHRLGLVDTKNVIESFAEEKPLLIFLHANHDPASSILKQELERLPSTQSVELRFATASFMGYGLFDQGILTLEELKAQFGNRIHSKG